MVLHIISVNEESLMLRPIIWDSRRLGSIEKTTEARSMLIKAKGPCGRPEGC